MNPSSSVPVVFVIDDDPSVCKSLSRLFKSYGLQAEVFDSASGFLASGLANGFGCLVLDIHMPGLCGLELQEALAKADCMMPIIFLTGHGDIPMSVRAMKGGAVDFLTKPVDEGVLMEAVKKAVERSYCQNRERNRIETVRARIHLLTAREHEVMSHVISGELNKQIAGRLGVGEKTIKVHRARVMEKMDVESVAELVRLCSLVGEEPVKDSSP
jgi:FixJ family two-component response regulator